MAIVLLAGMASTDPGSSILVQAFRSSDLSKFRAASQVARTPDHQVKYFILVILVVPGVFYHVMTSIPRVFQSYEVEIYLGNMLNYTSAQMVWVTFRAIILGHPRVEFPETILSSKHLDNADKGDCGLRAGAPLGPCN